MLPTLLRIGPLVLLEMGFLMAAWIIWMFLDMAPCCVYTLTYLAAMTFLSEMIISLRMVKTQKQLRKDYLQKRVMESDRFYFIKLVWDNLNFLTVVILLLSEMIYDGLALSSPSDVRPSDACDYTLFSICLFGEFEKALHQSSSDNIMVMWLLYAVASFITLFIIIFFSVEYYHFCTSVAANRKKRKEWGSINETLLDCTTYSLNSCSLATQQIEQLGVCSICINSLIDSDEQGIPKTVVRLSCRHMFHKECLDEWLLVRDHCPFRCRGEQ